VAIFIGNEMYNFGAVFGQVFPRRDTSKFCGDSGGGGGSDGGRYGGGGGCGTGRIGGICY